eukprot:371432-Amphidinium_carterae.1
MHAVWASDFTAVSLVLQLQRWVHRNWGSWTSKEVACFDRLQWVDDKLRDQSSQCARHKAVNLSNRWIPTCWQSSLEVVRQSKEQRRLRCNLWKVRLANSQHALNTTMAHLTFAC